MTQDFIVVGIVHIEQKCYADYKGFGDCLRPLNPHVIAQPTAGSNSL